MKAYKKIKIKYTVGDISDEIKNINGHNLDLNLFRFDCSKDITDDLGKITKFGLHKKVLKKLQINQYM